MLIAILLWVELTDRFSDNNVRILQEPALFGKGKSADDYEIGKGWVLPINHSPVYLNSL